MADLMVQDPEDMDLSSPQEGGDKSDAPQMSTASAEERDTRDKEETFGDIAGFLKKHNPQPAVRGRKDAIDDRYLVRFSDSLPDLDSGLATAHAATDDTQRDRKLYALIPERRLPYRLKNIEALVGFDHHSLVQLVAAGPVEYTHDEKVRFTVVHEAPRGITIRQALMDRRIPQKDTFIIDDIIAPLCDVLRNFQQRGIAHGCINLDTVWLSDRVQLGECVSEPAGYSQHYHFESPERTQANQLGKGDTTVATDCYALGVLVLHIMFGMKHFEKLDSRNYLSRRLTLGTYNVLVGAKEFKGLEDFLKGVLNDDPKERWTPEHIEQWVKGKKYNLLTPSVLREAQRPFNFGGEDFFNRKALAHAFSESWEESKTALRSTHLSRWVEVSLHKTEMAEDVRKVMERAGGIAGGSDKSSNELVARSICLLDPEGPVRYSMVSAFPDGLGMMLADAFRNKNQKLIQSIIEILDYNFYNYTNDLLDGAQNKRYGQILWKMGNCSRYLRMQAMGFGIERILYELNPTLACQSPLLVSENVLTIEDLLGALDRMGTRKSKGFDYLDRHIAAFLAMKMDMTKEVKIHELQLLPALAQNPQLIVLHMLSQAQRKAGRPKLKGLSAWAALRVVPLVDNFHSRSIRRKLRQGLKSAARSGELDKIFELIMDQHTVNDDHNGFQRSVLRFSKNAKQIAKLENRKRLKGRAELHGMMLAMIVGYATLLISGIMVILDFFY